MALNKDGPDARSQPQATIPRALDQGCHDRDKSVDIVVDTLTGVPANQDDEVIQLARDMQRNIQTRRTARRQQIEKDYHTTMQKLEDSMNARVTEISKGITKKYRLRAQNLAMKMKKRSDIENRIFASLARVEQACNAINMDLQIVLEGRISSIRPENPALP